MIVTTSQLPSSLQLRSSHGGWDKTRVFPFETHIVCDKVDLISTQMILFGKSFPSGGVYLKLDWRPASQKLESLKSELWEQKEGHVLWIKV